MMVTSKLMEEEKTEQTVRHAVIKIIFLKKSNAIEWLSFLHVIWPVAFDPDLLSDLRLLDS